MGKKGRKERSTAAGGAEGGVYAPRSNDDIIGKIGPGACPSQPVINQLKTRLAHEISCPAHQQVLAKVQGGQHPITYETPGMLAMGDISRLIFGLSAKISQLHIELPSCAVQMLRDGGMGESGASGHPWPAGTRCMMLNLVQSIVQEGSEPLPGASCMFVFLGECNFVSQDLWDFAVMFREGRSAFKWPGSFGVIQCPFCAKLAEPDDRLEKTWIMLSQICYQRDDLGRFGQRFVMRLACKDCFLSSLSGATRGDSAPIPYPEILECGACAVVARWNVPLSVPYLSRVVANFTQPAPKAYSLLQVFDTSGMCGACTRFTSTTTVNLMGGKNRLSKSMTAFNGGQDVIKLSSDEATHKCDHCHATKETAASNRLSVCSGCAMVHYCGAECQKAAWREHKVACKAASTRK